MTLIACRECGQHVSEWAAACPHCGISGKTPHALPVTVGNVNMKFGTMVVFLVKMAIAMIPAAIILVILAAFGWTILAGMLHR